MSHAVRLSDETYRVMRELADDRGQSPEELVAALLADAWERECAL
jgi:predicted transcriptional regulator